MVNAYLAVDEQLCMLRLTWMTIVVSIDTSPPRTDWLQDSPDLFIGLYDWRGKQHGAYQRGENPDYHFRFSQNQLRIDNGGSVLMKPGSDYAFVVKQSSPRAIPWIPYQLGGSRGTHAADDTPRTDIAVLAAVEGMRIPIDFSINDNDTDRSPRRYHGLFDAEQRQLLAPMSGAGPTPGSAAKSTVGGVQDQATCRWRIRTAAELPEPVQPLHR